MGTVGTAMGASKVVETWFNTLQEIDRSAPATTFIRSKRSLEQIVSSSSVIEYL